MIYSAWSWNMKGKWSIVKKKKEKKVNETESGIADAIDLKKVKVQAF